MRTRQNNIRGFTLVEMLVSIGIFAIIMSVSMGTLIVVIRAGSTAQTLQLLASNASFAIDDMSRHIRTGYDYYCANSVSGSLPSGTADCEDGGSVLVFTNAETGKRMAYRLNSANNTIEQRIDTGNWFRIVSTETKITALNFIVLNTDNLDTGDLLQPTVRILIKGQSVDTTIEDSLFFIQTTVVSRSLDV